MSTDPHLHNEILSCHGQDLSCHVWPRAMAWISIGGGGEVLDLHFIMCVGGVKEKLSKAHSVCVVCVCCVCVCVCLGGGVRCNRVYLLMGVDFM